MAKDFVAPQSEPPTDRHPPQLVHGEAHPEPVEPQEEDFGLEIDNAIERPREGQPGQRGSKPN